MAEGFYGDYRSPVDEELSVLRNTTDWQKKRRLRIEITSPDDPWRIHADSALSRHSIVAPESQDLYLLRDAESNVLQGYLGVRDNVIRTLVGSESRYVNACYNLSLQKFIAKKGINFDFNHPLAISNTGLVPGRSPHAPSLYFGSIYNLPPNFAHKGDLVLSDVNETLLLPEGLIVQGAIKIFGGSKKVHFGEKTQVIGPYLAVDLSQATPLPEDLMAKRYAVYKALPDGLPVVTNTAAAYNLFLTDGIVARPQRSTTSLLTRILGEKNPFNNRG